MNRETQVGIGCAIVALALLWMLFYVIHNEVVKRARLDSLQDTRRLDYLEANNYTVVRHPEHGWAIVDRKNKMIAAGPSVRSALDRCAVGESDRRQREMTEALQGRKVTS